MGSVEIWIGGAGLVAAGVAAWASIASLRLSRERNDVQWDAERDTDGRWYVINEGQDEARAVTVTLRVEDDTATLEVKRWAAGAAEYPDMAPWPDPEPAPPPRKVESGPFAGILPLGPEVMRPALRGVSLDVRWRSARGQWHSHSTSWMF